MSPNTRIERLLEKLSGRAVTLNRKSRRFSRIRLIIFLVGASITAALWSPLGSKIALANGLAFGILFLYVALRHDRVEKARKRLALWQIYQRRNLARVNLDWDALADPPHSPPPDHPYAADLDVAGPRSLLHLIDSTSTVVGSAKLRDWFLSEPDFERVQNRQVWVRALVGHRRFRERLGLLGMVAAGHTNRWDYEPILKWLQRPAGSFSWKKSLSFYSSLAALNGILVALHLMGGPAWWFYSLPIYAILYLPLLPRLTGTIEHLYKLGRALSDLSGILIWIEKYIPRLNPLLTDVWGPFRAASSPSLFKKRIDLLGAFAAYTEEGTIRVLLNLLLPYDLLLIHAYDRLHARLATTAQSWIEAYTRIDALNALATFADLNPSACAFPTLLANKKNAASLSGQRVAHPLLPADTRVSNDIELEEGRVAVITGSNMSGKSTYLRATGLACLMAWAGGPVCAESFSISPMQLFTSMRVGDAIQEGKSTFYAEVVRLRNLMAAVNDESTPPTLVLIDEMLRGTNTKERLIGVTSIVQALAGAYAISLVATHDQEVTKLAVDSEFILNFHFKERIDGDKLTFDYKIFEGASDTTNALIIMRRAGLPVPV